ncbi:hypothetical protein [Acrocarpospora catenulata]|uniref:hypothetical protein n=1 Tax=Acrocarpospora catenulata TaxID=2836182 RepID=UPI001BDA62A0|nr:hypothetical protein [Acrocarpospora catenulata]
MTPKRRFAVRLALVGGLWVAAGVAYAVVPRTPVVAQQAGHSGHSGHSGASAGPSKVATAPMTLEELAARIGCQLQLQGKSRDKREGACLAGTNQVTVVSFDTDEYARAWLDEAQSYGGTYLVGTRWVVVGSYESIQPLEARLGGTIERPAHGSHQA